MKNTALARVSAFMHSPKIEKQSVSMMSKPPHESGVSGSPMKTTRPVHTHERVLVLIEQPPWSALYRMGVGFVMLPLFSRLSGQNASSWWLVVWFVGILFALRLIPAVLRKVLPFSGEVSAIWFGRRQLAKSFDSYQWQKLFWLGMGLAGYTVVSKEFGGLGGVITGFCLISGGLGLLMWWRRGCDGRDLLARGSSR